MFCNALHPHALNARALHDDFGFSSAGNLGVHLKNVRHVPVHQLLQFQIQAVKRNQKDWRKLNQGRRGNGPDDVRQLLRADVLPGELRREPNAFVCWLQSTSRTSSQVGKQPNTRCVKHN